MEQKVIKYYTTSDLIELLGISRTSIWRAIKSGQLVVSGKGGYNNREDLFSQESVDNYISNNRVN